MNNLVANPKCKSCKSYWKPCETDILTSGLVSKTCLKCRNYQKELRENRDYQKGKIYTITSPTSNDVYVGSTIQSLNVRMEGHISEWKRDISLGKHKDIVKDINDWNIRLYEKYPCNNLEELLNREGEVIKEIGTLNIIICGKNNKECNKEKNKNKKIYCEEQKDDLEIYIENQKEDLKKYIENQKEDLKKYLEEKKEDYEKYIEEQKDNFKERRIENAYNYSLEQKLNDEEYQKKLLKIEDEYDNGDEEEYSNNMDRDYDYTLIYMKKRTELLKKKKIDKMNKDIDKMNKDKESKNVKGIIYTFIELKKLCRLNKIKMIRGSTSVSLALDLSKIENIIIPDDMIYNPLKT